MSIGPITTQVLVLDDFLTHLTIGLERIGYRYYDRAADISQPLGPTLDQVLAEIWCELDALEWLEVRFVIIPHQMYGDSVVVENGLRELRHSGFLGWGLGKLSTYGLPDEGMCAAYERKAPYRWAQDEWEQNFGPDYWQVQAHRIAVAFSKSAPHALW